MRVWGSSFDKHLRDEVLNEHSFFSLLRARTIIETWRWHYSEERSKRVLGELMLAAYEKQMAAKSLPSNPGLQS